MNIKTEKVVTVSTTISEMKNCLEAYQDDLMLDLLQLEHGIRQLDSRTIVSFTLICQDKSKFRNLCEKHSIEFPSTPSIFRHWEILFTQHPYIFGVTDEVVTEGDTVFLSIDDCDPVNVSCVLKNI